MKTVPITYFGNGMADDYTRGGLGEFSVSKHFDILTYPQRLQPLRGMTADTTGTGIGNIIAASDGFMYGVGEDDLNPGQGALWRRAGFGAGDVWSRRSSSGATVKYPLLVNFPAETNGRTIIYAANNLIWSVRPSDNNSGSQALTFTNIAQGFIHPKQPSTLYIPYDNKIATYIGATLTANVFSIGTQYRITSVTSYGDSLAIAASSVSAGSNVNSSVVYLWDRDTSNTIPNDSIAWGTGYLRVLNNLLGTLIGISVVGDTSAQAGTSQDYNAIKIKYWNGGAEPTQLKEIVATRLTTTAPSCVINERVNFINNDRFYFSVNVVNGGTAPAYYGLWSVGKNKNGNFTVTVERVATNANTETGVLAAAIVGDFVSMVHTAVGTITSTINGNSLSAIYAATSVYESVHNPEMDEADREKDKKLFNVYATYLPLPASGQVIVSYRVDSSANGAWTTIFTETTDGVVFTEMPNAAGTEFTDGRKYEFKLESTGGAIITGFGYRYDAKLSNAFPK